MPASTAAGHVPRLTAHASAPNSKGVQMNTANTGA